MSSAIYCTDSHIYALAQRPQAQIPGNIYQANSDCPYYSYYIPLRYIRHQTNQKLTIKAKCYKHDC